MSLPPKCPFCGKYWHIKCHREVFYADHKCTKGGLVYRYETEDPNEELLFDALKKFEKNHLRKEEVKS